MWIRHTFSHQSVVMATKMLRTAQHRTHGPAYLQSCCKSNQIAILTPPPKKKKNIYIYIYFPALSAALEGNAFGVLVAPGVTARNEGRSGCQASGITSGMGWL